MKPILRHLLIAAALLLVLAGAALAFYFSGGHYKTFENHVYVWQTTWAEPVAEAAKQVAPAMDSFMAFAGAFTVNGGRLAGRRAMIDWEADKLHWFPPQFIETLN